MLNTGQDCAQGRRIALGLVRRHPHWCHSRLIDGASEEALCRCSIATRGEIRIDDLPILVNCAVDVGPRAGKPRVCFINSPLDAD
jgi:hypothetical protein